MNNFKLYCERVLSLHHISADDTFILETSSDAHQVSYSWVIDTFDSASDTTQDIFKASLEKAILQGSNVRTFFQEMGQMAVGS